MLVITFVATVVLDLATVVILGIVVAGALALRAIARSATLEEISISEVGGTQSGVDSTPRKSGHCSTNTSWRIGSRAAVLRRRPCRIARSGGGQRRAGGDSSHVASDLAGCHWCAAVLADTVRQLEGHGVTVLLSGLPDRFVQTMRAAGLYDHLTDLNHVFARTPDAIDHARRHVARDGHHTVDR